MDKLIAILTTIIETFGNEAKVSDFERGQIDGLRWAIDIIEELTQKNPAKN